MGKYSSHKCSPLVRNQPIIARLALTLLVLTLLVFPFALSSQSKIRGGSSAIDISPIDNVKITSDNVDPFDDESRRPTLIIHRQTTAEEPVPTNSSWSSQLPFALQIIMIIVLVSLSGLFSGLTLGLMSLDTTGLEIVMDADDPISARNARKIYPVRCNGNLLLCTLLLGNVAVNALLSIIMADITSGLVGFITSTVVIVIFGEIVPQAACSRYALRIGSKSIPVVKVIICLFYPVAKPLAFALDKILGRELGTIYTKAEMRKLLEITVERGGMDKETGGVMEGALKFKDVTVKEVMTPLEATFMLNVDEKLSFDTISRIFKAGYSRIPVYEVSKNNVIGLLFVKDLIFVDPEDETPVHNFVQIFGRGLHVVWPDDNLGDVLRELKQGKSHMAIVRDVNNEDTEQDPFYEIKGIITLEDIIEVILGDEIVDETDAFVDVTHNIKVARDGFDWGRLRLLDTKITDALLSHDEVAAISAHLKTNHNESVKLLSDHQLKHLVATTCVTELQTAKQEVGEDLPSELLYVSGQPTNIMTIILSGKVTVLAGSDMFRSDVSSWSVLGSRALTDSSYMPDFTAYVSHGPCRCIHITRERFTLAMDSSAITKLQPTSLELSQKERLSAVVKEINITQGGEIEKNNVDSADPVSVKEHRAKLMEAFRKSKSKSSIDAPNIEMCAIEKQGGEKDKDNKDSSLQKDTSNSRMNSVQMQLTDGGSYLPRPQHAREKSKLTASTTSENGRVQFMDCKTDAR